MSIRADVAAALEAEGMTPDVSQAAAAPLPDVPMSGSTQALIVDAARAMTAVKVPYPVQVSVFWRAFGAGIGGGGGAGHGFGIKPPPPCPWCAGTGAHGGWCPGPYLGAGPGPHISEEIQR